ncbi:oxidoreductase [Tepiditoga spiralis]|uniref:Oxidoreductase n=1 Tax=Tepiditoga spiralis TaxID=2108365 RepID=A0A7G1G3L9_9BACT|nr:proton-conducting transporter membrane subunit [Tepiditoga spiralis]BBE30961.1 oxidoreductase [Tepiditoga spiralis]
MFAQLMIYFMLFAVGTFFVSKINKKAGSYLTIIGSVAFLIYLYGFKDNAGEVYNLFSFGNFDISFVTSSYAWYFSMIMVLIYSMISFMNPFFIEKYSNPSAYNAFYLVSMAASVGMFYSKDFLTLFAFYEVAVWTSLFIIPMGKSRKASVIYYTMSSIGSLSLLYSIFLMYTKLGTFDIQEVGAQLVNIPQYGVLLFFLIILSGITKLGIFPFYTWLPAAHGSAPNTFSPILSGALVKIGGFISMITVAVLPFSKMFENHVKIMGYPFETYIIMILASISIVVGTLMAIKQDDAKKLIAYSTVSNSGYILLGISIASTTGFAGGMMHVLNHALASAAMFATIGAVYYRTGTTKMSELGGLIKRMPITFTAYLIAIISLAGIPPMSGFASKWLIFQALVSKGMMFTAIAAFFGSVGSFLYVFRPLSTVFLGQLSPKHNELKEVPFLMQIPMWIFSGLTIFYGIFPGKVLEYIGIIEEKVGIQKIHLEGTKIFTRTGMWDSAVIFWVFTFGFIIAAIIYFMHKKSKKVGLMDTYTSAEFIYDPERYHYAKDYYAPFERLYNTTLSVEKFFNSCVQKLSEFGGLLRTWFFNDNPVFTVFWVIVFITVITIWGGIL